VAGRHDHGRAALHQIGGEHGQVSGVVSRRMEFDRHALVDDVARLGEALPERVQDRRVWLGRDKMRNPIIGNALC
jgi:hypothetical protein